MPQRADRQRRETSTARVKGCGKSAPGGWQQNPHGKPHPEQGRIGAARFCVSGARAGGFHASRPGWLLEPCGNARPRGMAAPARPVAQGKPRAIPPVGQNPAYRPPGNLCVKAIMTDDERGAQMLALTADPEPGVALGCGLRKVRFIRESGGRAAAFERFTGSVTGRFRFSRSPWRLANSCGRYYLAVARDRTPLTATQTASIRPSQRWGRHFNERGIPSRE